MAKDDENDSDRIKRIKEKKEKLLPLFKKDDVCTKCGICCYLILKDPSGEAFFTPFHCQFLNLDTKLCTRYADRHAAFAACSNVGPATRHGFLSAGCPYTVETPGYVGPSEDYRTSPFVTKIVDAALAAGPDENGLYTVRGYKFKFNIDWNPSIFSYPS